MDPSRITELCDRHGIDLAAIQTGSPRFESLPHWLRYRLLELDRADATVVATAEYFAEPPPVAGVVAEPLTETEPPRTPPPAEEPPTPSAKEPST